MGNIGIFFVGVEDKLVYIIEGYSQAGVHFAGFFPVLWQSAGHSPAHERVGAVMREIFEAMIWFCTSLLISSAVAGSHIGFPHQGIDDSLSVPE